MSPSQDPMNEELFTLRELLIQEIEFAFGIRDLPDSEHDGDDTEHDAVDFAGHYNVDVERNMSGFGYDIVHAERLRTPNFVSNSTMAFTEDTTKLLLLANVALGTYSLEGQQPAPTLPPQAAFALNTARPTVQPVIPSPSGWGMNSAYRGFTPINPRPHPRTLPHLPPRQLTRPLLQPLLTPTPAPPVPIRKQRVRKSQKVKRSRTTGFDKKTGEGMLTDVCGIRTPEIIQPVPGGSGEGDYCCPRCHGRFTRSRTVKDHFITCVRKYGNPAGLKWFDDRTLAANKIWHLNHLAKAREEGNVGGDEETVGQEEDGDLEGVNEDQSRDYNISAQGPATRDHRTARLRAPPLSLRQGSHTHDHRPEPFQYPPLGHGYVPRVQASPYDPIVPQALGSGHGTQVHPSPYDPIVPQSSNTIRRGEIEADRDREEASTPAHNTRRTRGRSKTDWSMFR